MEQQQNPNNVLQRLAVARHRRGSVRPMRALATAEHRVRSRGPIRRMDSARGWILLSLMLAAVLVHNGGCASREAQPFGFRLHTYLGNGVDTFARTASKDMILRPDTTIALELTGEELEIIRQKIVAARFFEFPDTITRAVLTAEPGRPDPLEQLEVRMDHKTKIVTVRAFAMRDHRPGAPLHDGDRDTPSAEARQKIRTLIRDIMAIVSARAEYKALPRGEGGYL